MPKTQTEIENYLIDIEYFKKGFFNDSDLAELLQHYTGLQESSLEWTEIIQYLFNFIKVYKEKS